MTGSALLGRGGMGEVYRAEDVDLQRPVALKIAGIYQETASAPMALGVLDLGDGRPRFLFEGAVPPTSGIGGVAWTPDGSAVRLTTAERTDVWRQALAQRPRERVTNFSNRSLRHLPSHRTAGPCSSHAARCATRSF